MPINRIKTQLNWVGGNAMAFLDRLGYASYLLWDSLAWLMAGHWRGERVRLSAISAQMMQVGVSALPIVLLLSLAIGMMLAIQMVATLSAFGAESKVVIGVSLSVSREFASLIVGVLVAGRTASSLAARIGAMVVSQEVDALRVIGVSPVRYLVSPVLIALLIMMPVLTLFAGVIAILGAGLYSMDHLNLSLMAYLSQSLAVLVPFDIVQGLIKSTVFGLLIALVGVSCGFSVQGGAEGVGRATTSAVVQSISVIVIADMIFTYFLTR